MAAKKGEETGGACSSLAYRKLVDGGMIYDREKKLVHHLNCTAAHIWESCQEGRSREQIARDLCLRFEVDIQMARVGVEETLAEFAAAQLIEP